MKITGSLQFKNSFYLLQLLSRQAALITQRKTIIHAQHFGGEAEGQSHLDNEKKKAESLVGNETMIFSWIEK